MRVKKHLLCKAVMLAILSAIGSTAWAGVNILKINLADGSNVTFALADKPKMGVVSNEMVIETARQTVTIKYKDLVNFTFCDSSTTGIDKTVSKETYQMKEGQMLFEGLRAGEQVLVYNAVGIIVLQTSASADGNASVDTTHLPNGVYIARTAHSAFKFLNKNPK